MVTKSKVTTTAAAATTGKPDLHEAGQLGEMFNFDSRGDKIAGILVGTFTYTDNWAHQRTGYRIREAGVNTVKTVFERGDLGRKMVEVAPGAYVEITYLGMTKLKKGAQAGKDMHTFKVMYAAPAV